MVNHFVYLHPLSLTSNVTSLVNEPLAHSLFGVQFRHDYRAFNTKPNPLHNYSLARVISRCNNQSGANESRKDHVNSPATGGWKIQVVWWTSQGGCG